MKYCQVKIKNLKNHLIVSKKKVSHVNHQLIFNFKPLKIFKLIESINIEFMKNNFSDQFYFNIFSLLMDSFFSLFSLSILIETASIDSGIGISR